MHICMYVLYVHMCIYMYMCVCRYVCVHVCIYTYILYVRYNISYCNIRYINSILLMKTNLHLTENCSMSSV